MDLAFVMCPVHLRTPILLDPEVCQGSRRGSERGSKLDESDGSEPTEVRSQRCPADLSITPVPLDVSRRVTRSRSRRRHTWPRARCFRIENCWNAGKSW